jgi:hypothetical protein
MAMKWQVRCMIRSVLPWLPFQPSLRKLKRAIMPINRVNGEFVLNHGTAMIVSMRDEGFSFRGSSVLELGTGWQPIVPIVFSLLDPETIFLVDKHRLLDEVSLRQTVAFIREKAPFLEEKLSLTGGTVEQRLGPAASPGFEETLRYFRMEYRAPQDAAHIDLPDASMNCIYSWTVLEHIPPAVLAAIVKEFKRVLRRGGLMVHMIDNSDHWSHKDSSITTAHFLRFEDNLWKFFNSNPLDFQNRLRVFEYRDLFEKQGFTIKALSSSLDERALADLETMRLCSRYRGYDKKQLASVGLKFVCTH